MCHGATSKHHRVDDARIARAAPAGAGQYDNATRPSAGEDHLLRAREMRQQDVAEALGVSIVCVNKWSQRFEREGLEGLRDKRGRGRRGTIPLETVEQVITQVGQARQGRRRWSTGASEAGVSAASVQRIWRRHAPHLRQTPMTSSSKRNSGTSSVCTSIPGESASCVATRRVSATLERTQPGLPLGVGHIRTATHDYIRHGITLFALELRIRTEAKHTHVEWLRFLKQIDRETPKDLEIHMIADNYGTHKHANVRAWMPSPAFSPEG